VHQREVRTRSLAQLALQIPFEVRIEGSPRTGRQSFRFAIQDRRRDAFEIRGLTPEAVA